MVLLVAKQKFGAGLYACYCVRGPHTRHLELTVILVCLMTFSLVKCTKYDSRQSFSICADSASISIASL